MRKRFTRLPVVPQFTNRTTVPAGVYVLEITGPDGRRRTQRMQVAP